jgi:hypothetical protein
MALRKDWILILLAPRCQSQWDRIPRKNFVSYNSPGLVKRLDWAHPSTEPSWKLWRDWLKVWGFSFVQFCCGAGMLLRDLRSILIATSKLWYPSKDGTNIIFLCSFSTRCLPSSMALRRICSMVRWLYFIIWMYGRNLGYGSNKVSFFCPLLLTFADTFGGVVSSIPNIRGGLGIGSSWSDAAGSKAYKVNSVDDFISATFVSPHRRPFV